MNANSAKSGPDDETFDVAPVLDRMLASNMSSSMTIALVNAGVAAALLVDAVDGRVMAAWFLAMAFLAAGRRIYCDRLLRLDAGTSPVHLRWLAAVSMLAGIGWGVLPFLLTADAPAASLHVVFFMVAGMTAGASLSYASHISMTRAFNAPCLALVALYYVLSGGLGDLVMVVVIMIYFLATDMLAQRAKTNLVSALENEARAERQRRQIEHQKTALETLAENYRHAAERAERAEADLIRKNAELALIFDNVPARIWCKDDKNNVLRLNKAAAETVGLAIDQAVGASTYDLFPDVAKEFHDDDLSVIESGTPKLGMIKEYATATGRRGWAHVNKIPYTDPQTGRRLVFVAAMDITELRRAQEELLRANDDLAQFARVASHDLQEPLKELSVHGARLKELAGAALSTEAQGEVDKILEASERMRALVRDVLNLARMPSSRLKLQSVAPDECIEAARHALGCGEETPGVEFIPGSLPEVMAEPALLTRIYQNLISNALKFSAERSQIRIEFTSSLEGGAVVLGVRDNGVGLNPAYAERIFEPLARAHDRKRFDGTGIGLAICKKGVERMGGKIWVETAPGKGAHFKFRLKAARRSSAAA